MPHIVKDIGWGLIDIVEHESRVFSNSDGNTRGR